ncbi:MAG: hypothetical protein IID34_14480 [Planctomycetes bacterium]|nr:hypothetical protein [Planctomycetota bacterium]
MLDGLNRLGPWEEHYSYMMDAFERVFERNDWVSDSDLYALDMVREIEALPPGDFGGRLNKMKQMLGDRYLLTEEQENRFGQTIMREAVGVFMRHSDRIMEYSMDAINTRAAGEAFTPEQIAKWVKLSEPVVRDAAARMEVGVRQMMVDLEPEQRELMQRDLDAAKRRISRVQELSKDWAKGKWDPADWGMEDDPIQVAGERAAAEAKEAAIADKAAAQADERAERDIAESRRDSDRAQRQYEEQVIVETDADDDAWAAYVKSFIRKYRLNEAQQNRAWAIYRDVKGYGDKLRTRAEKKTAGLKAERAKADASRRSSIDRRIQEAAEPLRRVFDQMKRRLDRLPTRAQRRDAAKDVKADRSGKKTNDRKKANRRADGP